MSCRLTSDSPSSRSNQHIFDYARYNVARGRCPPLPARPILEATRFYSHTAYASFVFGESPCSICSKPTHHIPTDFHLRFRACSGDCKDKLDSLLVLDRSEFEFELPGLQIPDWRSGLPCVTRNHALGIVLYMVERRAAQRAIDEHADALAVTAGRPRPHGLMFRRRNIEELHLEYAKRINDTAELAANSSQLKQWTPLYLTERQLVRDCNLLLLKRVARAENFRLRRMFGCPAFQRVFRAFNRDLALITYSVWMQHREVVLSFVTSRAVAAAGKTRKDVQCPYCARSFTTAALSVHVVAKHPDVDPDALPVKPAAMDGKLHCRDCPQSTRVYSKEGLADHRRAKHST
uniref:C2H2-type domain-containing protein n=1 Tax=Mycena chlorophos TaxID=658473 RepID=A0ABQ0LHD3_MYCCL|nr:predicted protein [Mycena chlorophos]